MIAKIPCRYTGAFPLLKFEQNISAYGWLNKIVHADYVFNT